MRIQMFGGFSMYYGNEAVILNKSGNSKSVRLLQMLLLSLQGGIPKSELIDNLYEWNENTDMVNRNKNLNNLIYRLKGQLVSCGLPDEEYVELNDGMCCFKCRIPLELDVQKFERAVDEAKQMTLGEAKRTALLLKANEMYGGELLPACQSTMWFFHKSNYYKELYVQTIWELEKEFLKVRDYKNRLLLYARAAAIYPFENWQVHLIRCNLEIYRYKEALDIYNDTMELYSQEMGTPPTAELQKCFEEFELMDDNHRSDVSNVNNWKNMDKAFMKRKGVIRKAILGEENVQGAYYCTYPSFVDYCRLVVRLKSRNPVPSVLMFLTLSWRGKKDSQKPIDLQEQMGILKEAVGSSLRIGDAYTRYGNRHFILLLANTEKGFCDIVFRRIEITYEKKSGKAELWYYADMTQVLEEAVL